MSEIKKNPALGDWDEYVKEHMTPEEIAEMEFHSAITGVLIDARNEGRITQQELEEIERTFDAEIEETEEISARLDTVFRVLYSLGKTLAIVPIEQNGAN